MKASAEKTSSTASVMREQAPKRPFFSRAGGGDFSSSVQAKMAVSHPGDRYEQEAENTADKVVRMSVPTGPAPLQRHAADNLQRRAEEKILRVANFKQQHIQRREEEKILRAPAANQGHTALACDAHPHRQEEKILRAADDKPGCRSDGELHKAATADGAKLQRDATSGNVPAVDGDAQRAIQRSMVGGEPLAADVRDYMEPRFDADFSRVRVHQDGEAAGLSNRLGARAFTYQNHIFFSRGQYRPGTSEGRHLLAHELTHTIQQGHALQRSPQPRQVSRAPATPTVQRWGVRSALDKFADWAYSIPGFRAFTLVIGFNPINLRRIQRTTANVLRAFIELMPGGALVTQVLDRYGVVDKAARWVNTKLAQLGDIGHTLKQALDDFLDSLSWRDIFHLGDVWDRAKRIFTEPIDRLMNFAIDTAVDLLRIVKDAILKPLAARARGTRGYPLLCVLLGHDPISGEPAPATPANLIGGFMKLIGHEEIWINIQRGHAIPRAFAWFHRALGSLMGMVRAIPGRILSAITSLTFSDVVTIVGAFTRIAGAFIHIAGDFIRWGLGTIWDLLTIIFDVVKPGLMGYIRRTGRALRSILRNPLPFMRNLIHAAKLGFNLFKTHFGTHLKTGIIEWLTGSLKGVYIPKAATLPELGKFALSVLGVTWAQIRGKIVNALGPNGERIMQGLEQAFDVVVALTTGGIAAVWNLIKEKLADLKDVVIDGIVSFITQTIVMRAVPQLVAMFIPGAGFITAIIKIYNTIMVFVHRIARIIQVVRAFINSIAAIAAGHVTAAALRVENTLAGLLSLAINFLAGFLGIGNIASRIMDVVQRVRAKVDTAIDAAVNWLVGRARSLFARLFGRGGNARSQGESGADAVAGQPAGERWNVAVAGVKTDVAALERRGVTGDRLGAALPGLKIKYGFTSLRLQATNRGWTIRGAMSPEREVEEIPYVGSRTDPFDLDWPKPASSGYPVLFFGGATSKATEQSTLKGMVGKNFEGSTVKKYRPLKDTLPGCGSPLTTDIHVGQIVGPLTAGRGRRVNSRKLNENLKKYGYSPSFEHLDADHVQELQFGGEDEFRNLWPLDSSTNQSAGSTLAGKTVVHKATGLARTIRELKADTKHKYYFRITSTR